MEQEIILNEHYNQEYQPKHTAVFNTPTIKLLVLMLGLLLLGGCKGPTQTNETSSDSMIVDDSMDGNSARPQEIIEPDCYDPVFERNKDYYGRVLAFDQKVLRGVSVSSDEAFALFPKTDDEMHVLWHNPDGSMDGYDRGFRHDSICFRYAMENPSIEHICKYYVAFGCADGMIAEQYHDRCYQLWEKHPAETSAALAALYTQKEAESILKGFQEESLGLEE